MPNSARCAHFAPEWLYEHGAAYCSECGYVDRYGFPCDPATGKRRGPRVVEEELLYDYDEAGEEDGVLFLATRSAVEECRRIRARLASCTSTAQAREALPYDWFTRATEDLGLDATNEQGIDGPRLAMRWPPPQEDAKLAAVLEVVRVQLSSAPTGWLDSGRLITPANRWRIFRALARYGYRCRRDSALGDLF